jgi:F0F1-type ATP synthase assembly protein I
MKQTAASQAPKDLKNPANPSTVFVDMAMDMSWRLAIVVIVPIVAGFKVDEHLGSSPLWTIVGFLLALAGMAGVLRRMLREAANQDFATTGTVAATNKIDNKSVSVSKTKMKRHSI